MAANRIVTAAAVCAGAVALGSAWMAVGQQATVPAGPNKVAFPESWSKGVMYGTIDRPDLKQYREFYTTPDVIEAVRAGRPIPDGAVLTLAAFAAQVDAAGNPIKDANGRYVKGNIVAVNSMQKKAGWGQDIPAEIRNGDWIYQSFTPDGKPNEKANLTSCYQCHLPFAKEDYLTNLAKLKGTFPSQATAAVRSGPTDVAIAGFAFGPGTTKIASGQKITWTNADDTPHQISVTGGDGRRSDLILKGQSATLQFDTAGTFGYVCGLHPVMKGTIEVAAK